MTQEMKRAKLERLRRIVVEAAKQSGRTVLPEVTEPIPLEAVPEVPQGFVAHPGSSLRVREVLNLEQPVAFATGPEGGFTAREVALLEERGFVPVTLGRRILRAETAAVALVALVTAGEGV